MNGPPQRVDRTQSFRNLVAALVIGGIFAGLGLVYLLLLSQSGPGPANVVGALCTFGFLVVAFVAWEFFMKPGYGLLHRRGALEPVDDEEGSPRPPSTGPP